MALPLELGQIRDEWTRRALERIGLQFPIQQLNMALRTVRGTVVGTTGAARRGEQFTSTRTGLGQYTITFAPAFNQPPIAVASLAQGVAAPAIVQQNGDPTITTMLILVSNPSVAFLDADFSFIAIGP